MDRRLKLIIIAIFLALFVFIGFMFLSEYKNMESLRVDYPELPEVSYEYRKDSLNIWAIRLILSFLVPLLFLTTGLSQRISLFASRGRGLILSGIIYGFIFFGLIFLINLPINYYSSFFLRHKYGLTDQSFLRWIELNLKGFLINNLPVILLLWIPYSIIYRSPKTWWLQIGLLIIPIIIFIVFISPLVIDPLLNNYTSIEDQELGVEINKLLEKANIEDAAIYKVDKSKDTKTMNAYMTGIYKSKRIVLWDTTINNLDRDEVLSITAHEIGHYVKGHIWKNILFGSLGSILILFLVYISSNWILYRSYGRFGFKNIFNYASLPLFILLLNFYNFIGSPISNYITRSKEIEADRYEISLTEDRESAITAMEKLYKTSLGIPRPSKLYKIWYHTHPSLEERVEFYKNEPFE